MAIVITESTCGDAWEAGVRELLRHGAFVPSERGPVIELSDVTLVVQDPWGPNGQVSPNSPTLSRAAELGTQLLESSRIVNLHGMNQLDRVVAILQKEPFSRRAVINVWDPSQDLASPNPQGVIAFVFSIREGKLNLSSFLRTTDAWLSNWTLRAIPELQNRVWERLRHENYENLGRGTYTQSHVSFHLYLDERPNAISRLITKKNTDV